MSKRSGRSLGCVVLALVFALLPCGCAQGPTENGLTVEKDGQVVLYIVDSFDKGYYDIDELREMAQREVDAYNAGDLRGSGAVTLEEVARVEENEQLVRVVYRFPDGSAYSGFQKEELYYETVDQAIQSKHLFSGSVLFNGEESITIDRKNQEKLGRKHILVTDAATRIRLPYEVAYYSEGVQLLGDGRVDTSRCVEPAVLLLKK